MQNLKNIVFQNYYSKILRIFTAVFKKREESVGFKNTAEINPEYYWKILIFIFAAGLILIFMLNLYFFRYLSNIEFRETEKEEKSYKIRKVDSKKILENYETRKTELEKLMLEKPVIVEP